MDADKRRCFSGHTHLRASASIGGSFLPRLFFSVPLRLCVKIFQNRRILPNFCSGRVATQRKEQHQSKHPATKLPDFRTQPWGPPAISDKSPTKKAVSQQPHQPPATTFALLPHPPENKIQPETKLQFTKRRTPAATASQSPNKFRPPV